MSNDFNRNGARGDNLTPGSTTVNGGATLTADEATTQTKTLGLFVEEALAFNDRLFLTAAVRSDQNSAFGTNFQRVFYPKASLSWIISDQSFFHKPGWLDQLRLRSAYGASGVQPGPTDALLFFRPATVNVAAQDQPGVQFATAGNSDLRPERATEFEGGFDYEDVRQQGGLRADVLQQAHARRPHRHRRSAVARHREHHPADEPRLGQERRSRGAAHDAARRPPQLRLGPHDQRVDERQQARHARHRCARASRFRRIVGTTTRNAAGYPLFGFWQRKYTYHDDNDDGIITANEVHVADSATFVGYSSPRYQASHLERLRAARSQAAHRRPARPPWRQLQLDGNDRIRCQSRNNCSGGVRQIGIAGRSGGLGRRPRRSVAHAVWIHV